MTIPLDRSVILEPTTAFDLPPAPPAPQPAPAPQPPAPAPAPPAPAINTQTDALVPQGTVVAARPGITLIPAPTVNPDAFTPPQPPPILEPAPEPPAPTVFEGQTRIPVPGKVYIDLGNGIFIPAPSVNPLSPPDQPFTPAVVLPGQPQEGSDEPSARGPSLVDFGDPLDENGIDLFGNPPLEGQAFIATMRELCQQYDIDPLACAVNGYSEGFNGLIGDDGEAYGPWQDWLTKFRGRPWYGAGKNNAKVNAWAWSRDGIEYAVRSMAATKARGEKGSQATYDIAYYFERPQNRQAESVRRAGLYDPLSTQAGLWDFMAGQAKGPKGFVGSQTTPAPTTQTTKHGPDSSWKDLIDFFTIDIPKNRTRIANLADSLKGVFDG